MDWEWFRIAVDRVPVLRDLMRDQNGDSEYWEPFAQCGVTVYAGRGQCAEATILLLGYSNR